MKIGRLYRDELGEYHWRLLFCRLLASPFPSYTGNRVRAFLFRAIGFSIGRGVLFYGAPIITGSGNLYTRLVIGDYCQINHGCFFDLCGNITLSDRVGIGPQSTIITGNHRIGQPENRVGECIPEDVVIGAGTWIGARCLILPGVKIGSGVVVAAGAVVNKDVPDNVLVGGTPAKIIKQLE